MNAEIPLKMVRSSVTDRTPQEEWPAEGIGASYPLGNCMRTFLEGCTTSPISALLGALIGGGMSLIAAIYTRRCQDRLQRIASEVAKRETVYSEFVSHASNLLLHAYTHDDIVLNGDEQHLMGLVNRIRFFAPPRVVGAAEAALRAIVEISLKPSIELRKLATDALSKSLDPDPLLEFSLVCRADLDDVRRTLM